MGVSPLRKVRLLLRRQAPARAATCQLCLGQRGAVAVKPCHYLGGKGVEPVGLTFGHQGQESAQPGQGQTVHRDRVQPVAKRCQIGHQSCQGRALGQPEGRLDRGVQTVFAGCRRDLGQRARQAVDSGMIRGGSCQRIPTQPGRAEARKLAFGHHVDRISLKSGHVSDLHQYCHNAVTQALIQHPAGA